MDTARKLRILLVEDDNSIAKIIELGMHDLKESYHLDQAISAEEGLDLWGEQPYDLVLSDYNLRGMNGLALIKTLKEHGTNSPMVLFTAYDTPQLRKEARDVGVAQFIAKPFFVDQFVNLVRTLLPCKASEVGAPTPAPGIT